jgi:hypothetical protein
VNQRKESKHSFCFWCTRQRRPYEVYPFDNHGLPLVPAEYNTDVSCAGRSRKRVSSSDSDRVDMTMPEIKTNMVDPGIDMERWSHVRDHIIPPKPGPPPNRPLPPTPTRSQSGHVHSRKVPVPQVRQRNANGQSIRLKPVAGQWHKHSYTLESHQMGSPPGTISPVPRLKGSRIEPPLPLVLDTGREVPEMAFLPELDLGRSLTFNFLQNGESNNQERKAPATRVSRGADKTHQSRKPDECQYSPVSPLISATRSGANWTNRSREKPDKFQYSPVSPLTPKTYSPITRHIDGPNRRAQTTDGRYERAHSMYGDMAYISPKLEHRIDDVEEFWTAGARLSEDSFELRFRAETEPIQQEEQRVNKRLEEESHLVTLAVSERQLVG